MNEDIIVVKNCYDCPFWNDGAGGEYTEQCNVSDIRVLEWDWDRDIMITKVSPPDCPLRTSQKVVVLQEGVNK